jgi:hypothetical protein
MAGYPVQIDPVDRSIRPDRCPQSSSLLARNPALYPDASAAACSVYGEPRPPRSPPLVTENQYSRLYSAFLLDSPDASSGGYAEPLCG